MIAEIGENKRDKPSIMFLTVGDEYSFKYYVENQEFCGGYKSSSYIFLNLSYVVLVSDFHLDPWIILFDSVATNDIFSNKKLLKNIHSVDNTLTVHCNNSSKRIDTKRNLPGYGEVWFRTEFIANILSLANLPYQDGYHVWFDNCREN